MTRHVRLFVTVGMVLGCHSPMRTGKDGAASDARVAPTPPDAAIPALLDAATPTPLNSATPVPLDTAAPAPLDSAAPAPLDAAPPVVPDARSPALPDTGVRGRGAVPVAISAGQLSTCALFSNGSVKCWGANGYGQLGNGTTTDSAIPVTVQGLDDAIALSASGGYHACAVRADRTVVCWGNNYEGLLGDGSQVDSATIKTVLNLGNAVGVSTGSGGSCATLLDQTARCWGSPPGGIGGSPTVPLNGVASIQVGSSVACALLTNGTVRCWGDNTSGQIGNGTFGAPMQPVTPPSEVKGLDRVIALSLAGISACALLADHTAMCWGSNIFGQLGNGYVNSAGDALPVPVSGLSNVVAIATAGDYTCALLADGTVRCWGSNLVGTLGNGTRTDSAMPVPVSGLTDIVAITTGGTHACALAGDGTLWCWGQSLHDQLGNAIITDSCEGVPCSRVPVRVEY